MQGGVASVIFRTFRPWHGLSSSPTIPICTIHQLHWPRWSTFLPSPNALAAQACLTNSVSLLGAEAHYPGVRCHVCFVFFRHMSYIFLFSMKWVEMKGSAEASSENVRFDWWRKLHFVSVARSAALHATTIPNIGPRRGADTPKGGRNITNSPSDYG